MTRHMTKAEAKVEKVIQLLLLSQTSKMIEKIMEKIRRGMCIHVCNDDCIGEVEHSARGDR